MGTKLKCIVEVIFHGPAETKGLSAVQIWGLLARADAVKLMLGCK